MKIAQIQTITPGDPGSTDQSSDQSQSVLQPAASDDRPESARGNRVILDEQIQSVPQFEESKSIPTTTWYWLGAAVLLVIAFVAASSLYHKSQTDKFKNTPKK
ncbi:hypothetical protein IPM19_03810 [bacterium]|nr:MAG: hypothetical protein IPM19_03810 [bacterium]